VRLMNEHGYQDGYEDDKVLELSMRPDSAIPYRSIINYRYYDKIM